MGIFSRFRDIVSANLNSILDSAEDPEKLVRLMIQEMEETLIEVKSNCAGLIAEQTKLERARKDLEEEMADWTRKAELAVNKGRDDLARGALTEKRRLTNRIATIDLELTHTREAVASFKDNIAQLESKLNDAREKQRSIIQRRIAAKARTDAQSRIRDIDTSEAFARFEAFEQDIDRVEAESSLVDSLRPRNREGSLSETQRLREELNDLAHEDEIENELNELKGKTQGQ